MKSVESVGFWCRVHRGSKSDVCMLEAASPVARCCTHGGGLPQPRVRVRRYLRPLLNERGGWACESQIEWKLSEWTGARQAAVISLLI